MSRGATFQLVTADTRFDPVLVASAELRRRLDGVRAARRLRGEANVQPELKDLLATHLVPVAASFKPYVSVTSGYLAAKAVGGTALTDAGDVVDFTLPSGVGHFSSDMVLSVRFDPVGASPGTGAGLGLNFRYVAYPGIRLLDSVEFRSNDLVIDEYGPDDVLMQSKFFLKDDYRTAFDRCMGQQTLKTAEFFNPQGFTGVMFYRDGAQTPKPVQPALQLFIPLQFWMCRDPGQALCNDLVPNTQRRVRVRLAALSRVVGAYDSAGNMVALPFRSLKMAMTLHVNTLYVNPEVHDVFASRVGAELVRVHRRQRATLSEPAGRVLMSQLKYPCEYLMAGVRDPKNLQDFDDWTLMGQRVPLAPAAALVQPAAVWNPAAMTYQVVVATATSATTLTPMVAGLSVALHGNALVSFREGFFGAYMPFRYFSDSAAVAPDDEAVGLISFCLRPGDWQPSGYYNLSAGRELYVSYTSDVITPANPGELVVVASALNFLIRKGDSCTLQYSL